MKLPLDQLHVHVVMAIKERLNLGHLYTIEEGEDGPTACCSPGAAESVWRAVTDAITEAGWKITIARRAPSRLLRRKIKQ